MSDLTNATEAATLAVRFDQMNETDKAVECYRRAARFLDRALSQNMVPTERRLVYANKVREYLQRASVLQEHKGKIFV